MDDWKPTSGQVALIELGPDDATCLTGVVLDTDGKLLLVDLGASARRFDQTYDVTVSVFDPDALYRIEATLLPHDGTESIPGAARSLVEAGAETTVPTAPSAVVIV